MCIRDRNIRDKNVLSNKYDTNKVCCIRDVCNVALSYGGLEQTYCVANYNRH